MSTQWHRYAANPCYLHTLYSAIARQYQCSVSQASADNIKKWKFPRGEFLMNLRGHNAVINAMSVNQENVLVTGGDEGSLHFWDWKTVCRNPMAR